MSDSHEVCSHAVSLVRPAGETEARQNCAPTTVTLPDPVQNLLLAIETDKTGVDADAAPVTLPAVPPTVTAAFLLPATSLPALQTTQLSDAHAIASQAVAPKRPVLLKSLRLILPP